MRLPPWHASGPGCASSAAHYERDAAGAPLAAAASSSLQRPTASGTSQSQVRSIVHEAEGAAAFCFWTAHTMASECISLMAELMRQVSSRVQTAHC